MPPIYWSTGSQASTICRSVGAVLIQGSVKRAKYQDESTKVSIVSVSRRAWPPHCGQTTCFQVGWRSSGFPGRSGDARVARGEIRLALGARAVAAGLGLEPPRHLLLGLLDRHAVEETRIDHAAVAVIGGVGDDEGFWIDVGRAHHRRVAEAVF